MATPPFHRTPRLRDVLATPAGHLRLAVCTSCAHTGPLPLGGLLRQHTEFTPLKQALKALRCSGCGEYGTIQTSLRKAE